MGTFAYRAITAEGRSVRGTEVAENTRDLVEQLHARGILVTDVRDVGRAGIISRLQREWRKPSSRDLALLFRQLATLLAAGVPVTQSLALMETRFPQDTMRRVLTDVRADVEQGHALSTALVRHPRYFSELVAHTIRAGEAAGALDVLLPRLAVHFEKEHALKQKLRAAAIYPVIVATVSAAAILFLLTYVVPTLVGIYEGLEAQLPWQTRLLIGLADAVRTYWLVLVVAVVFLVIGVGAVRRTAWGQDTEDFLALSLPVVGRLNQMVVTSRFCRTLATLISSGVPLLRALEITVQSVGNRRIAQFLLEVHEGVRTGGRLGSLLARHPLFANLAAEMVMVGEESGSVDVMLDRAADYQDVEIDYSIATVGSAVEPALIIALGLIVGFVVVSMYLPLFELVRVVR